MGIYYSETGQIGAYPWSRKESRRLQKPRYMNTEECGECGQCSIRFTRNGECIHCCRLKAIDAYNKAVAGGGVATSVDMALAMKINRVVTPDMCSKWGHIGLRDLNNNCVACLEHHKVPSARQIARATGKRWYTPTEPCKNCGTTALRYVANGRCQGCKPLQRSEEGTVTTAETVMIQSYPNLVFSKDRAIREGLTVYRTGEPCKHGHTTYRRVRNGACISCR